jgi:hypothetical protein
MAEALARQLDPTQLTLTNTQTAFVTVPAGKTWTVKSIIVTSQRADSQTHNYDISQQVGASVNRLLMNKTITPGETQIYEFACLVMNAGDQFLISGAGSTGLYIQIHGLTVS